jgi:anti-sigma regulatory factor (Ser/Thr protein kinase)
VQRPGSQQHHIELTISLDGVASDPSYCRRAAGAQLEGRIAENRLVDVLLVVSELVANGVLHAGTPLEFHLRALDGAVTVAVDDDEPVSVLRAELAPAEAASGRGLSIVDSVADAWGVEPHGAGKRVWARFDDVARLPSGASAELPESL